MRYTQCPYCGKSDVNDDKVLGRKNHMCRLYRIEVKKKQKLQLIVDAIIEAVSQ